jgi:hypothetical protein
MTVLTRTTDYLVEFEDGMLTIARREDGHCLAVRQKGIAGGFRADLAKYGAERVVQFWLRLLSSHEWKPLYKASAMPRLLGDK